MKHVDYVNMISVNMFCEDWRMETMSDRLRKARTEAGFKSARSAALKHGWTVSTYAAHENGQNEYDADAAAAYGRAFKVSPGWLLTGDGSRDAPHNVTVMGRIGAGAEIMPDFEQMPPDGLFEIETMIPMPDGAIAFEVDGDSMWPRYDPGDVVICWRDGTPLEDVLGYEAAVKTEDGRRFLKRVLKGAQPGTFDLESHNAAPIRGVKLDWVSAVGHVIRRGQWSRLSENGKKRALMRMTR